MLQSNNSQQLSTTVASTISSMDVQNGTSSSVPIQVVNLADGAAFIPIGNSPFFQIASSSANPGNNNTNSLVSATNLVNSMASDSGKFLLLFYLHI